MTKKPSLVSRFLVLINALLLFALFLIMGGYFPIKGLLPGVLVPVLSFINIGFFFYWILRMRWPFLLFLVFFLLNFQEWNRLYKFPNNAIVVADGFKVMSYNVRLFNQYNWLKETQVPLQIEQFIYAEDPDIICLQEYSSSTAPALIKYPYRYLKTAAAFGNNGVGIFSKFPLLRTGQIDFENSSNGGVYADIRYRKDTLRVYNLHLESFQLQRTDSLVDQNSSARFLYRLDGVYEKQLDQIKSNQGFGGAGGPSFGVAWYNLTPVRDYLIYNKNSTKDFPTKTYFKDIIRDMEEELTKLRENTKSLNEKNKSLSTEIYSLRKKAS